MSMQPQSIPPVPPDTEAVARAAFPKGNIYVLLRDNLGSIYADEMFTALFSKRGQPAESPWRLALISIMQFVENLSDRQAADAVRSRIDWKYALSLPLTDPGFDFSILSEFRQRLISADAEQLLLDKLLERLRDLGLLKRERQRTDSTHVIAAVRHLNRLETLGETLRAALNSLATVAPDWLMSHLHYDWFDRYSRRIENYRLPKLDSEREALGNLIGKDGFALLNAIYATVAPEWLRQIKAVEILRQVWVQQFYAPGEDGEVQWRKTKDMPPSTITIHSPYDVEAHYSNKRSVDWVGYKTHVTETCGEDCPHLITQVYTTLSTVTDDAAVEPIHQGLEEKSLLPNEHLMDTGYVTAEHFVNSRTQYDVEIIGPVRSDPSWQARNHPKFAADQFKFDWDNQVATCPMGQQSVTWLPEIDKRGQPIIDIRFPTAACRACRVRRRCTRSKKDPRGLTIRAQAFHTALQTRRQSQETPEFLHQYHQRAGIEATLSQGTRRTCLRRSRYRGLAKTHLQHILIATALNFLRLDAWFNEVPIAKTRISRFKQLQPKPA
ncbi:IS1182 family transposase [Nostocales cyanobacterium LEGE 11386]|nr:IS1182 family transposase [Nostocales cyanobacterium LEGE 11386]